MPRVKNQNPILHPIPILQRSRQNRHLIGQHSGPASHFIFTPTSVLLIFVRHSGHVIMLSNLIYDFLGLQPMLLGPSLGKMQVAHTRLPANIFNTGWMSSHRCVCTRTVPSTGGQCHD
jgi:hypothetical protein